MVVKRSALVPRTQRKKLELNPSYGYGAMSKNVSKCVHGCALGAFSLANESTNLITRISGRYAPLILVGIYGGEAFELYTQVTPS